jgi:putative membrane protein insertion efficiency factor
MKKTRTIKTIIRKIIIFPIILYKKIISPILPNSCRFYPSCSQYAIEAIEKRGIFIGILLAIWRILRCNPFSKGGIDLVP